MPSRAGPKAACGSASTVRCASSGYDAGKKIKGRKRHILTDTPGLWLGVVVTPASVQDRDAAKGFVLLPRRWVVERIFGWLVRDHERNPRHHEALVYTVMIGHSPRHLTANPVI
jgi:hypothetical protein